MNFSRYYNCFLNILLLHSCFQIVILSSVIVPKQQSLFPLMASLLKCCWLTWGTFSHSGWGLVTLSWELFFRDSTIWLLSLLVDKRWWFNILVFFFFNHLMSKKVSIPHTCVLESTYSLWYFLNIHIQESVLLVATLKSWLLWETEKGSYWLLLIIAEEEPTEIQNFTATRPFESKRNEWVQKRIRWMKFSNIRHFSPSAHFK